MITGNRMIVSPVGINRYVKQLVHVERKVALTIFDEYQYKRGHSTILTLLTQLLDV